HPEYALSLNSLGSLYHLQGTYAKAEPLYRQALFVSRKHLDAAAERQSERQQLRMAENLRFHFDSFLTIALDGQTQLGQVTAFLLQAKGAIYVRQRRQRQLLELSSQDNEVAHLAAGLERVSRRLATLASATPQPQQQDAWRKQLAELTDTKERLEA